MLSIRNILPDGQEDIMEFVRVSRGEEEGPDGKMVPVIFGARENGDVIKFHFGVVYVMNSHGSTINSYVLNQNCQCTCECTCK